MVGTRAGMRWSYCVGLVCLVLPFCAGCRGGPRAGPEAASLLYQDLRSCKRDALFRASCFVDERHGGPALSPTGKPEAQKIKLEVYDPPLRELQDHARKVIAWLDSLERDRRFRIVFEYEDFPWAPYFSD